MTVASEPRPSTGQPVGLQVADPTPGPRPGPVTLEGRFDFTGAASGADLNKLFGAGA